MHMFLPPVRRQPEPTVLGTLTPAAYLRLRREAAGVKIDDLARALVTLTAHARPLSRKQPGLRVMTARFIATRDMLILLEAPGNVARRDDTLRAIESVIPFDPAVYRQLATEPADRHPRVCRGCGQSDHDPSIAEHDGVEHVARWITPNLCSHCIDRATANAKVAA